MITVSACCFSAFRTLFPFMDRSRDGSRRGSFSGGPVSAPRRPRSYGFKESSVVDDDDIVDDAHNSRLRDRFKKEISTSLLQGNSFSSMTSGSRHKRKRQISKEARVHGRTSSPTETNEAIEDSEMGASEDDEDSLPATLSRRPGKLRSQGKILDEGNAVDISAVPRKVRTAVAKRPQEPTPVPLGNTKRQQPLAAAAVQPVSTISPPSTCNDAFKPARRTKQNGAKLRAAKVSTPSVISEQEVEVAEALFDLANMVPKQRSPSFSEHKFEVKSEVNREPKVSAHSLPLSPPASLFSQASTPLPAQLCSPITPVSSPVVSSAGLVTSATSAPVILSEYASTEVPASAEAAKRKNLPRVRVKVEDGTVSQCQPISATVSKSEVPVSVSKEGFDRTAESVGSDRVQGNMQVNVAGQNGRGYGHVSSSVSGAMWVSDHQMPNAESISVATAEKQTLNADCANSFDKASTPASSTESKTVVINTELHKTKHTQQEDGGECKLRQQSYNTLTQPEKGQSPSNASANDITYHGKCENNVQVLPVPSSNETCGKLVNSLGPIMLEPKDKTQATSTQSDWIDEKCIKDKKDDEDSNVCDDNSGKQMQGMDTLNNEEKVVPEHLKEMVELKNMDVPEQSSPQIVKNVKSDSKLQQKTDTVSSPMAALSVSSGAADSIGEQRPQSSVGIENWQGSIHHVGYYAPLAAAVTGVWPELAPMSQAICVEGTNAFRFPVSPFGFSGTRQSYKHCAAHVYIAHFIDVQQQMRRHPLWAASYGKFNPTKPQSPNVSIPPDAIFGIDGSEEKRPSLYMDTVARKAHTQQSAQERQPQRSLQDGTMPTSGYSVTDAGPSSLFRSSPIVTSGIGGVPVTGTGLVSSPASVFVPGISTSNGNVVSAAAAQAQYLQAMIQGGLSYSFPHGHYGPSMNSLPGHITQQQATQFFGNHFYNTPLVHQSRPQLGPSAVNKATSGISASEQRRLNLQQGLIAVQSESQRQQQQLSQSQQHVASQQLQHSVDRDNIAVGGSRFTSIEGNMLSQGLPNMQVSTISSSSPVIAADLVTLPDQKPSRMAALGGKQAAKFQKQQHQSSLQQQAQHQVNSTNIQQRPNSSLYLKSLDSQASQVFPMVSMGAVNKSSIGPGPLGLAPVAAVMAPQGHVISQNMAENGVGNSKTLQEQMHQPHLDKVLAKMSKPVMDEDHSNVEDRNYFSNSCSHESKDHKWTLAKQAPTPSGPSKVDLEASSKTQLSPLAYSCGEVTTACTSGNSDTSFNLMVSGVGNLSSRQILTLPIGFAAAPASSTSCSLNAAIGKVKSIPTVKPNDSTSCSFSDGAPGASSALGMPFRGQVVSSVRHGPRQAQAAGQLSSPGKAASRMQPITAAVSTSPTALARGMYAGSTVSDYQGHPARGQRRSLNATSVSRLPMLITDTYMDGSLPVPMAGSRPVPLPPTSKLSSGTDVKNSMLAKGPFNLCQKQCGATVGHASGAIFTHSSGSIATKVGESLSQQNQPLHQQGLHNTEQKQQHHQYQEHGHHHQHQQVQLSGGQKVKMQYGEHLMTNQVGPHGLLKDSGQGQSQFQAKPQPFLQEQLLQQQLQQQQSSHWAQFCLSTDQQSMPHHTQQQSGKKVQRQSTPTTQTSQQYSGTQRVMHQTVNYVTQQSVLSVQQPLMFPSLSIACSSGFPHNSTTFGVTGRIMSSDEAFNQATGSSAATPVKSSRSPGGPPTGCNLQKK